MEQTEHELSCRRCQTWTEVARKFGGTRLGPRERFWLVIAGSTERREWREFPSLPSADRNVVARLRRERLLSRSPKGLGRGRRWQVRTIGETDAMSEQERERYENELAAILGLGPIGSRKVVWFKPLLRTPLGDAVVDLYEEQLRGDKPILSDWDTAALAARIVETCPDRAAGRL
jgi:hypothetical protein